ncbi:MAG: aldehyde dehydrogenase family protein [Sinobacteraceae bacterium]|nr:aldehyde dehydrogenase family protein [Nevskiaceae bacterium]MBV9914280.1 aldehyde dehydrogenase family protein [Nevskiaceae bacterium]
MSEYSLTIGGKAAKAQRTFAVLNPLDESVVAACPEGTAELVDEAVASARRAFKSWSAKADAERVQALLAIADLIEKHHGELSQLITREQGKTQSGPGANFEVGGAAAWMRATAGLSLPEETLQDDASGKIVFRRKPVGVVASITPWNWPLIIAVWHIAPALRVGCTVVIKPSPFTPLSTLRLVELMNQVLPPGVINVVTGGAEVGNRLVTHPEVNKVVFTGSVPTGKKVMEGAAQTLKRVTLELGGNDAGIILPGTKIEPLLEKLFWGCFINAGQTCAALKRLYVHEDQYEEVVQKLAAYVQQIPVGDGLDPKNLIGPVSNRMQFDKVSSLVEDARRAGARIVTGGNPGKRSGYLYPLTVIADATDEMRVVREEQFGPVIPVLRYRSVTEALERANALEVGLGGSVWGNDPEEAARLASQLECGTAWVNQHGTLHPMAPFGGVKCSGIGVEFNVDGLKEYTTLQVVNISR